MFKQANLLKQLSLYTLLAGVVLSTLLVLPITDNFVAHTKTYLLFAVAILMGILFVVRSLKRSSFDIVLSPLTAPLLVFAVATLISTFATNTYPVENLLGFGGVYLATVAIALFCGSLLPKDSANKFMLTFGASGVALFALTLIQSLGFGPAQIINQIFNLDLPAEMIFNLAGSSFIALQLVIVALVGLGASAVTQGKVSKTTAIMTPLLLVAGVVFTWSMLPGKPASIQLPSLNASWSVALDTLRLPKSALIGVGPASYGNVYNQFKPLWVNTQSYWNVAFNQAINMPFTLLTTMGVIGLGAWVFLAVRILRMSKTVSRENKGLATAVLAMLVLQLFLPANVVMLTVFGISLAILIASERQKHSIVRLHPLSVKISSQLNSDKDVLNPKNTARLVSPFGAVVALLLIGLVTLAYFTGRTYAAHVLMNESSKAVAREDVVGTYEKQQQAVQLNPYLDVLRRRYAATNMLIAIAISNKTDATEADQEQVGQLLQQAIREARAATLLDPGDVENWITLAQIYENMTGATEEALQWAVQSYVSAVETSPADPSLRLALGGIFMGQQDFNQASNFFQQSVSLKPDFANGYYNLAVALRQLGQLDQAKQAYQQVLVLIDPSSDDYVTVTAELESLEKEIAEKPAEAGADGAGAGGTTPSPTPGTVAPSIINENLQNQTDTVRQPSGDVNPNLGNVDAGASDVENEGGAGVDLETGVGADASPNPTPAPPATE